jgi:hypothetical protein
LIDGEPHPYGNQLIWPGVATLSGLPATSVPIGMSPQGLPIGIQIVGPSLEDRTPLKLAQLIETEFGGFVPPPNYWPAICAAAQIQPSPELSRLSTRERRLQNRIGLN